MAWKMRGKRNAVDRDRDRLEIAQRYLRGESQMAIARAISEARNYTITQVTVSRELATLRDIWRQSAVDEIEIGQAKQLAKIDAVESEAWAAWERSKERSRGTERGHEVSDTFGTTETSKVKRQSRDGDPRFLNIIQSCIEQRCKILGLNAPQKYEHSGPGGTPIEIETDESIRDRIAGLVARFTEASDSAGSGD